MELNLWYTSFNSMCRHEGSLSLDRCSSLQSSTHHASARDRTLARYRPRGYSPDNGVLEGHSPNASYAEERDDGVCRE